MASRDFLLPDLGEGLEDAEVVGWRVDVGDTVELNQTLVEVNTAKALVEIPSPWEGVVEKLHAEEGDVVKVGQPLVSIRVEGGAEPSHEAVQAAGEVGPEAAEEAKPKRRAVLVGYGVAEEEDEPTAGTAQGRSEGQRRAGPVPASPPVRRLAKEMGVDLSSVAGSGPEGRVTREDVMAAAAAEETSASRPGAPAEGDERIPVRGVRRLIAEKMARSAREIPHVTTFLTVDATNLEAFRQELVEETGSRLTALPIVVRAFIEVVKQFRELNASFDADASEIVLRGDVHVGVATDTERGLFVPVVRHADGLGLQELAGEIARLVSAAREGRSAPEDLVGGTVTVSNVGSFGAEYGTPIINYPESSILAVGVIEPRALVVDGQVEARPAVTLSLSFDHRVLDGAEAGRAMRELGDFLESPFRLGSLPH
jgi:2-oxoisovalerate dehydrogenase E2 component (dihydrolipoyl transacylase)